MRIDKLLSDAGIASRREAARVARSGGVTVDGVAVRDLSKHVDPDTARVVYLGREVVWRKYTYVMLNKPEGYVSATEDSHLPCVTELLPEELQKRELFPVGRLDRDTVGLMILTNDGPLAHAVLSPKKHVDKVYRFECAVPMAKDAETLFLGSITLADGYECKSAVLVCDPDRLGGYITLTEGKYHQIKRMVAATDNRVTFLKRVSFGGISLDTSLKPAQWRYLTSDEEQLLKNASAQ